MLHVPLMGSKAVLLPWPVISIGTHCRHLVAEIPPCTTKVHLASETSPLILQTVCAPASAHCPSQGRKGGLCWVSRGWLGRQRCTYRCGGVCGRRSGADRFRYTISLPGRSRLTCVLVYQDNANVLALNKLVEGGLDGGIVGLAVYHQEVLLRVWARRHMLSGCQVGFPASCRPRNLHQCRRGADRLPSPGSRSAGAHVKPATSSCRTSSPITARNCLSL